MSEITAAQVYQKLGSLVNEWQQFMEQFGLWQTDAGPDVTLTHPDGSTSLHKTLAYLESTLSASQDWYLNNSGAISDAGAKAFEAQHWAIHPIDSLVPEGNGVDEYSVLHHRHYTELASAAALAAELAAAASATAAGNSELAAAASAVSANASKLAAAASAAASSVSASASAADRVLAESAKTAAQTAEANAVAVVTGGTASLTPEAGKIPIAGAINKIDDNWLAYNIPALSAQYPGINAVASCLYDTSKDSDGGAWIHRTAELSYGKESRPSGRYLGQYATVSAAAAVTGAVIGDWYYNSTDKKFRELTAIGTPADKEIFRAGSAHFPSQTLIVAEATRVILFDASGHQLTMWMVFVGGYSYSGTMLMVAASGAPISAVAIAEGVLFATNSHADDGGLYEISFLADKGVMLSNAVARMFLGSIGSRNASLGSSATTTPRVIVNKAARNVAITVLDNAPIDPATGLKVPTVAVATDGGASVIRDNGTVVNLMTGAGQIRSVSFGRDGSLLLSGGDTFAYMNWVFNSIPATHSNAFSFRFDQLSIPRRPGTNSGTGSYRLNAVADDTLVFGKLFKEADVPNLVMLHHNPSDPTKDMAAHITDKKNTGWMVGDTKGAWLCETDTGAISAPELVTNGGFDIDTSGWASSRGAVISWENGMIRVENPEGNPNGNHAGEVCTFPTTVGKVYIMSGSLISSTGTTELLKSDSSVAHVNYVTSQYPSTAEATPIKTVFTATSATSRLWLNINNPGNHAYFDNISVKEVVTDHSGAGNHLDIVGTLNRAPIGNGEIAAWSGFSANNYLEQSYTSALDFTADFSISGWVYMATPATFRTLFSRRDVGNTGAGWIGETDANKAPRVLLYNSAGTNYLTLIGQPLTAGAWTHLTFIRTGNDARLYQGGVLVASVTGTAGSDLTNTSALFRLGVQTGGGSSLAGGNLALWRFSKTAPSADQIAKMYRDEKAMLEGKAVLDGGDPAVKALAYDRQRDLLQVASAGVVSSFRGLERVGSVTPAVGTIATLDAHQGGLTIGGSTGVDLSLPAVSIRERLAQALPKPGTQREDFFFTGDGAKVSFALAKGWKPKRVWVDGAKKRVGTAEDYTVTFDGFVYSVKFNVAPALNAEIDVEGVSA